MPEQNPLETVEPVSIFVVPETKRESTLKAVEAINDLGGNILTVQTQAGPPGTASGTGCTFSQGTPGTSDFVCTDIDA